MTHLRTAVVVDRVWDISPIGDRDMAVKHSVLVVYDGDRHNEFLDSICEFLDISVEYVTGRDNLGQMLIGLRPMAVIADLESEALDGFHVMKMVADYDRSVPVLLLTDNDPALLGAVDAVKEVWGLRHVTTVACTAGMGALVDFICHAARDAGMSRLMRV